MNYYFFNYNSGQDSYTVIFDCWTQFYPQELSRELKEFHIYNEQRRRSIFIYPALPGRESSDLRHQLSDVFNKDGQDIVLIQFNQDGVDVSKCDIDIKELFEYGVLNIIKLRNAVLESDDSFHYVLPSEKHSPFFIRTGNILSNSEEVNFLAMIILGLIKGRRINQIACDTSSILTLPYAVNSMLSLFDKALNVPISSFGSYASVDDYDFQPRTLVLISASNSGRLLKVIENRQRDTSFVTIIYNADQPQGDYLINIRSHFKKIVNIPVIRQFDSLRDCEYCQRNSIPVVVRGDQFMPSRILIQKVLLSKPHVPSWTKGSVNNLILCDSIAAFRQENLTAKRRELFIDVEKVLNNNKGCKDEFSKYLRNNIPASTSIILHLTDKSSSFIAKEIQSYLIKQGGNPRLITQKEIASLNTEDEHLILVVTSCVTTGNKLNSISRDLREFNKSSIHYFALINRLSDSQKAEVLKKNLEFRSSQDSNINRFNSILDCHLGDYHCNLYNEADKPSWDSELKFWKDIDAESNDPYVKVRIAELQDASGLINNLFLPKPIDGFQERLKLRKNFAFHQISEKQLDRVTQADLYFIVAAVFHYLRNPAHIKAENKSLGSEKFLVQHEHVKTIIDPVTFKRYNDGIIQAAILRIANNSELNYAVSDRYSLEMLETLKDIFKDTNEANLIEALLEFLLAIAIGKLKLKIYHMRELIEFMKPKYSNSLAKVLLKVCESKIDD